MRGLRNAAVLCYHAVSADWPYEAAIDPGSLERQVGDLLRRGYVPRTLSQALEEDSRDRSLVVTFDDAFASVALAAPVLERLGVPATLFVPTDFPDGQELMAWSELARWVGTAHEEELRCMSWDEIRALDAAGWEIGSHTCSHPRLTEIGPEAVARELTASRRACEDSLQSECAALAYPFGVADERVVSQAADAGYSCAVTLGERLLAPRERQDPLRISREGVYRSTSTVHFTLATSASIGAIRGWRPFRALFAR